MIARRRAHAEALNVFWGAIAKAAVFVAVVAALFALVFGLVVVRGEGMSPSAGDGDLALTTRIVDEIVANDLLVYEDPNGDQYVGRVVAMPGDTVEVRSDGTFTVNGAEQPSPTGEVTLPGSADVVYPLSLGDGQYFVLGDGRTQAVDSRELGPIGTNEVEGKVIALLRLRGF